MKETKKLAVIFPGIGYTADKPLLYYARRIAAEQGYEIMTIPYSGFPKKIRGDRKRMEESFRIALDQSEQLLAEVDLCAYDDVLFIGKSIGTIAAAKVASDSPAKEKIRLILFTPLKETFAYSFGKALYLQAQMIRGSEKRRARCREYAKKKGFHVQLFRMQIILWKAKKVLLI